MGGHIYRPFVVFILLIAIFIALFGAPVTYKKNAHHSENLEEIYTVCDRLQRGEYAIKSCASHLEIFKEVYAENALKYFNSIEIDLIKSGLPETKGKIGVYPSDNLILYFGKEPITNIEDLESISKLDVDEGLSQPTAKQDDFVIVRGLIKKSLDIDHVFEIIPSDNLNSEEFVRVHSADLREEEIESLQFCNDFNIFTLKNMHVHMSETPCFGSFVLQLERKNLEFHASPRVTLVYAEISQTDLEVAHKGASNLAQSKASDLFKNLWLLECKSMWERSREKSDAFKDRLIFSAACSPTISYTSMLVPSQAYTVKNEAIVLSEATQLSLDKVKNEVLPKILGCKRELVELIDQRQQIPRKDLIVKIPFSKHKIPIHTNDSSSPENLLITVLHECPNKP